MKKIIFIFTVLIAIVILSSSMLYAQVKKENANITSSVKVLLENKILALTSYVQKLVTENESLQKEIENLKRGNKDSLIISFAKRLYATNINIDHYRMYKNNNFKITEKAKLIHKSTICFEFIENIHAAFGDKTVDLILYDRAGNIVNCQEKRFIRKTDTKELCYSAESIIKYSRLNEMFKMDLIYDRELKPNLYLLEIYIDGYLCGKREFGIMQ